MPKKKSQTHQVETGWALEEDGRLLDDIGTEANNPAEVDIAGTKKEAKAWVGDDTGIKIVKVRRVTTIERI